MLLRDLVPFVQFKKRENTHGEVLLLVKLKASACNIPPWVFFHLFKIVQMVPNHLKCLNLSQSIPKDNVEVEINSFRFFFDTSERYLARFYDFHLDCCKQCMESSL